MNAIDHHIFDVGGDLDGESRASVTYRQLHQVRGFGNHLAHIDPLRFVLGGANELSKRFKDGAGAKNLSDRFGDERIDLAGRLSASLMNDRRMFEKRSAAPNGRLCVVRTASSYPMRGVRALVYLYPPIHPLLIEGLYNDVKSTAWYATKSGQES